MSGVQRGRLDLCGELQEGGEVMNHTVVRVYNNDNRIPLKFRTVEEMDAHLEYSVQARFGCAQFRDGKCVSVGYLGEERCKAIEAELLKTA